MNKTRKGIPEGRKAKGLTAEVEVKRVLLDIESLLFNLKRTY